MTIRHDPDDRASYETHAIRRLGAIAAQRGWSIDAEPSTRFAARITLPDGRRHVLIGADLGLNSSAARRVAEDKAIAAHFLCQDGLPTVPTFPIADAHDAARTVAENALALPLVIKPNRSHEARGLSIVHDAHAIPVGVDTARAVDPIVLLQPFDERPEYRLLLLGEELIAAFRKHPPSPMTPANLAAGATWEDATRSVHPDHVPLARLALGSLGLTFAAVDLFASDIGAPPADDAPAILEVNATPGLKALSGIPDALDTLFTAVADHLERPPARS